jgi:hypothetical protein
MPELGRDGASRRWGRVVTDLVLIDDVVDLW